MATKESIFNTNIYKDNIYCEHVPPMLKRNKTFLKMYIANRTVDSITKGIRCLSKSIVSFITKNCIN